MQHSLIHQHSFIRPPRAALFDFDGTLADTIPLIAASFNAALTPILDRTWTIEEVVARFGVPDAELVRREIADHPPAVIEQALSKYFDFYQSAHRDIVAPFDGIQEMLQQLRERQIPLGLMTGKGRRTADISLRELGWQNVFGSVVTGDEVARQKPAPDGVLLVAQQLNIAPQACLFVGDAPFDIGAGRAAGMFSVATGWNLFYGDALHAAQPDAWAQTPADILRFFD